MALSVKVIGGEEVEKKFKDMLNRVEVPEKLMNIFAGKAHKFVIESFKEERGSDGKWQDLKLKGRWVGEKGKRKFQTSYKILQDTGTLRGSILSKSSKFQAKVFTKNKYAKYHDQPGGAKKGIIPKRDFMWIDQKSKDQMVKQFLEFIISGKK